MNDNNNNVDVTAAPVHVIMDDDDDDDDSGRTPPPPPSYPHPEDILKKSLQERPFDIVETWSIREEDEEEDISDMENEDDNNKHQVDTKKYLDDNNNTNASKHQGNLDKNDALITTASTRCQRYKRYWILLLLVMIMGMILILGIGYGTHSFGSSASVSLASNSSSSPSDDLNSKSPPAMSPIMSSTPTTRMNRREDILKEYIASLASRGIATFANSDSGEYYALQWLTYEDPLRLHPERDPERLIQRYALLSFYYASDDWKKDTNWLDVNDECTWYGVVCTNKKLQSSTTSSSQKTHSVVVSLEFSDNGYGGTIPPDMTLLKHLTSLQLANNQITGTMESIPWERWDATLTTLNLSKNDWTGSLGSRIFQLTNLRFLDLSDNPTVTGILPSGIDTLSNLQSWKMRTTGIGGSIPTTIGALTKLITLEFSKFSKQIPTELGLLTNLGT
jgi:hypothetical protein